MIFNSGFSFLRHIPSIVAYDYYVLPVVYSDLSIYNVS